MPDQTTTTPIESSRGEKLPSAAICSFGRTVRCRAEPRHSKAHNALPNWTTTTLVESSREGFRPQCCRLQRLSSRPNQERPHHDSSRHVPPHLSVPDPNYSQREQQREPESSQCCRLQQSPCLDQPNLARPLQNRPRLAQLRHNCSFVRAAEGLGAPVLPSAANALPSSNQSHQTQIRLA